MKLLIILLSMLSIVSSCRTPGPVITGVSTPSEKELQDHCKNAIGEPRIERISEHVWLAIGYDLASVVLIHNQAGNIVVDSGFSMNRAGEMRAALAEKMAGAPLKALVYTHSHADHIGGAAAWVEKNTPIWATDAFLAHLYKQYGTFLPIESLRGRRQFGAHVNCADLPCSGIGKNPDIEASLKKNGFIPPNHTFTEKKILKLGNMDVVLLEAHGETHDQLMVWVPEDKTLIAADNFYRSFPNLYTLRGSSPRPVNDWIASLDAMRRLEPEHLVPCHTTPLHGKKRIIEVLTGYRDGIQWVRDAVVRGANQGKSIDELAETIRLPAHLSDSFLKEFYGQIDWSVRAMYTNYLGWFDGQVEKLYPLTAQEEARREVELMGGTVRLTELARAAMNAKDWKWSVHLLGKLRKSGLMEEQEEDALRQDMAKSLTGLALSITNTNGRGYLLETAHELRSGLEKPKMPFLREELMNSMPLETLFSFSPYRLDPDLSQDMHQSIVFEFPDVNRRFVLTVRRGIAEVTQWPPFPGTPEPVATVIMDSDDYRRMAYKQVSPTTLFATRKMRVTGSLMKARQFMKVFTLGL